MWYWVYTLLLFEYIFGTQMWQMLIQKLQFLYWKMKNWHTNFENLKDTFMQAVVFAFSFYVWLLKSWIRPILHAKKIKWPMRNNASSEWCSYACV